MSLIRKHVAVLQAWACLDLVPTAQDCTIANYYTISLFTMKPTHSLPLTPNLLACIKDYLCLYHLYRWW